MRQRTALLIESKDVALINRSKLVAALKAALPSDHALDELWLADTSAPDASDFGDHSERLDCKAAAFRRGQQDESFAYIKRLSEGR